MEQNGIYKKVVSFSVYVCIYMYMWHISRRLVKRINTRTSKRVTQSVCVVSTFYMYMCMYVLHV